MKPVQSILVATDFSAPARQAVDRAARLARQCDATLTLMHTLPAAPLAELRHWFGQQPAADGAPPLAAEGALLRDARTRLEPLAAELGAAHAVRVQCQVGTGIVHEEILRAAEACDADLVVLGTHGSGRLRRLVLGSTTERMLPRVQRPLLIVREAPQEPYRRALVALDFSPWSPQALAQARRLAPQAQTVLVHAYAVPYEERLAFAGIDAAKIGLYRRHLRHSGTQLLHAAARDSGFAPGQYEALVVEGEAGPCIVEQQQHLDCDLVVLGLRGQSATTSPGPGSVVRQVLAESASDVLLAATAAPTAD
jgi:nucleotide-binding universal stress UspA family protein